MSFKIKSFKIHKLSESMKDCQDSYSYNKEKGLFCVSDGASVSFFPAIWSQLLVNEFIENSDVFYNNFDEYIKKTKDKWILKIKEIVKYKKDNNEFIPYHLNDRINNPDECAAATFAGLKITKKDTKLEWQLNIIGDSCLFILDKKNNLKSFLMQNSNDFGYFPDSFKSRGVKNKKPTEEKGEANFDDKFILVTDALAKWILEKKEANKVLEILEEFNKIEEQENFESFVEKYRENGAEPILEDDDLTLMIIEYNNKDLQETLNELLENSSIILDKIKKRRSIKEIDEFKKKLIKLMKKATSIEKYIKRNKNPKSKKNKKWQ